jgi:hypothetical protein
VCSPTTIASGVVHPLGNGPSHEVHLPGLDNDFGGSVDWVVPIQEKNAMYSSLQIFQSTGPIF